MAVVYTTTIRVCVSGRLHPFKEACKLRHKVTQQRGKACVRRAAIKPPLLLLFRLLGRPDTTELMALDSAARDSRLRTRRALITVLALAFHFSGSPIWLFGRHYYFSALSTPRRCVIFAQNDAPPPLSPPPVSFYLSVAARPRLYG